MGVDPVTIAMLAGTAMQAFGAVKGGNDQAKAANYEAGIDDENAHLALLDGAHDEASIRRQERAASGEMIAAQGASGVQIGTGSALEALRENAYTAEYDALSARYTAATKAHGYSLDAQRQRAAARQAKTGGLLRAGAALLQGVSQFSSTTALARAQNPSGMSMPVGLSHEYGHG